LNQESYRKLISGQRAGYAAAISRFFIAIASHVYSTIIGLRNFLYSKGWLNAHTVGVPVISIGNITVGGTGKTPLVIWLCKFLQQKEFRCAVLTRGYKTHTKKRASSIGYRASRTDEPAILTESCPQAKVIVNPDRVAAATEALAKFGAKVLIMDDGFQHRRLHRDLDIVAIDATCPFGYGKIFPMPLLLPDATKPLKRSWLGLKRNCD
jgi:tetraacyldisaccharide 4'-kinase